jgi:endogenous inhibitor of DNA gyrase (YacG/DUF329 family)
MAVLEVYCPICKKMIAGFSESDISYRFQRHMIEEHEMMGVCDLSAPSPGLASVCKVPFDSERARKPYGDVLVEEGDRKGGPTIPGEDVAQSIRCPVCGETVLGHDINDLSFYLEKHMKQEHKLAHGKKEGKA